MKPVQIASMRARTKKIEAMDNNESTPTHHAACRIDFSPHVRILSRMAVVLCTGVEEGLLTTRKLMLENAGHIVIVAMTEPAILKACQRQNFQVAVIGQENTPGKKKRVFALVRRHRPSTKILEVYPIEVGRILKKADDWLALPKQEPTELVERVANLLKRVPSGLAHKSATKPLQADAPNRE